jgi:Fe-S cluster biogenesis protein NfuA
LTPVKERRNRPEHRIIVKETVFGSGDSQGGFMVNSEVEEVLDSIRPALQADGGDVELVDIDGGVVKVRLTGACGGCPMAMMTLKGGIEAALKERIPTVERVESV